jgi:hypothetical protein
LVDYLFLPGADSNTAIEFAAGGFRYGAAMA